MSDLLLPLQFAFMQNAFLMSALIAVPCALVSCFLVLRGWALMGDAISHAVFPGIVLAYLLGLPLFVGALIAGMLCAVGTGYLDLNSRVKRDTAMGVVFSGMFGLGLVLFSWIETDLHLDHILFGDMLGVDQGELWLAGLVAVLVGGAVWMKWRDLLLYNFDPAQAIAAGLPTRWLYYGLLAAVSLSVVATLKAVGLILAIGLLIAPGAIAFLLTYRFVPMLLLAVLISWVAMLGGVYVSFWLDSAPGPTVILAFTLIFVLVFAARELRQRRNLM